MAAVEQQPQAPAFPNLQHQQRQTDMTTTRPHNVVAKVGFKWLEILEREFDTAFVDLDTTLNQLDEESQDVAFDARNRMTAISSAFAQLVHKSTLIFEVNSRLERQLDAAKKELAISRTENVSLRKQLEELKSAKSNNSPLHGRSNVYYNNNPSPLFNRSTAVVVSSPNHHSPIKAVNNGCPSGINLDINEVLKQQITILKKENSFLRNYSLGLQSDLFGARLASKYLDKELAGRIQQIQLLAKSETLKGIEHDRLWNQLEAEIHLHRHKTVVKACRGRNQPHQINNIVSSTLPAPPGGTRTVSIEKTPNEGLGISITGGKEHGIPIIITEVHEGSPAARSGCLYVGDAILSVNGIDLRDVKHAESAHILTSIEGTCSMEVIFLYPEEEVVNHPSLRLGKEDIVDKSTPHQQGNDQDSSVKHNSGVPEPLKKAKTASQEVHYPFLDQEIMGPELTKVANGEGDEKIDDEVRDILTREEIITVGSDNVFGPDDDNASEDNYSSVTDTIRRANEADAAGQRSNYSYPGFARLCLEENYSTANQPLHHPEHVQTTQVIPPQPHQHTHSKKETVID